MHKVVACFRVVISAWRESISLTVVYKSCQLQSSMTSCARALRCRHRVHVAHQLWQAALRYKQSRNTGQARYRIHLQARTPHTKVRSGVRTCTGARCGGKRKPASSPCDMMTPPTMRVLMPHDDWCTCRSLFVSSRNLVSKARAKLSPRLWLVPACRTAAHFKHALCA